LWSHFGAGAVGEGAVVGRVLRLPDHLPPLNETSWRDRKLVDDVERDADDGGSREGVAHLEAPLGVLILGAQHLLVAQKREDEDRLGEKK
jgi:hypothetical protein